MPEFEALFSRGGKPARPCEARSVQVVKLVEVVSIVGYGTDDDPVREVTTWWNLHGLKVATYDAEVERQQKMRVSDA